MEVVYRAFNGTIFETEKECCDYENDILANRLVGTIFITLNKTSGGYFSSGKSTRITPGMSPDKIHLLISGDYSLLYLPNFTARAAFITWCNNYDKVGNEDKETCVGWNYYNDCNYTLKPLTSVKNLELEYQDDVNYNFICALCDNTLKELKG